ncbi:MAG: DUF3352 domain-containing protein [Chloroflexi bacterium]|nr:DUF3352 domain-containing protein [Chloroflexota bacterium]
MAAGRSRGRWLVAAIVVVAVLGAAVAATAFLGARPLPEALRYVPAGSAVVLELRPELPGDQRQHLGNFLAHFPGFADQSTLSEKIDEALGRLVDRAGNGAIDYARQVKPLLAGPMTLSMTAADMSDASSGVTPAGVLLVVTTDGSATCSSISGTSTTKGETYRGVALEVGASTGTSAGASCALDGRFLLYGMPAAIQRGIDAHLDGKGIDGDARFRAARERLSGDQVALAYVSGRAVTSGLQKVAPSLGIDTATMAAVPDWLVAGLRVVDTALQVELVTPAASETAGPRGLPTAPPPGKSQFAALLPATAFGFLEVHGMGASLQRTVARLQAAPSQAGALGQLQAALGSLGGVGGLVGWIEDLGVAGVPVGDGAGAGAVLLIRGTDAAAAQARLDQLRNLLAIASVGTDITVTTADHAGTAVTSVDLGDLGPTLESLGAPSGILPSGTHVKFSMAVRAGVLLLGVGGPSSCSVTRFSEN